MLVSYNLLKELIQDFNISVDELNKIFQELGYAVEDIKEFAKDINNVVIGQIKEIKKHPNADKLSITKVDIKDEVLQIITAAKNIKEGDKIPLALIGAHLYPDIKIKKSKLRGEDSFGMMCSAKELSLDISSLPKEQQEGILILPEDAPLGEDVLTYLDIKDFIFDIETPANRPDILGVYFLAKEIAFKLNKKLKDIEYTLNYIDEDIKNYISVEVENKQDTPRYTARIIKSIKVKPSELKFQIMLSKHNINSINNIVDATNYALLLFAQPLHAFDYDKVEGKKIIIRRAKKGEKILALDSKEYQLTNQDLVIADTNKVIALAGIIGGENSKVDENTKTIVLESAKFNQALIRKTAKRLGIRTDSSIRFEKDVSLHLIDKGAEFCISLIDNAKPIKEYIDIKDENLYKEKQINLKFEKIKKYLSIDLDQGFINNLFDNLNYKYSYNKDKQTYQVIPPIERIDIREDVDLIEEIARLYGYNNIPAQLPYIKMYNAKRSQIEDFILKIKQYSKDLNFQEVITYPLLDKKYLEIFNLPEEIFVQIYNPLTTDFHIARPCIIPSLLKVLIYNLNNYNKDLALFTIDKVFKKDVDEIHEKYNAGYILTGKYINKEADLFSIKSILYILDKLNIPYKIKKSENAYVNENESFDIYVNDIKVGFAGSLNYKLADSLEISQKVYIANIKIELLKDYYHKENIKYIPIAKYPPISRDLSFVLPYNMYAGEVIDKIYKENIQILEDIKIIDVYKGKPLKEDEKSITYRLIFRSKKSTLKDKQVDKIVDKLIKKLNKEMGVNLR